MRAGPVHSNDQRIDMASVSATLAPVLSSRAGTSHMSESVEPDHRIIGSQSSVVFIRGVWEYCVSPFVLVGELGRQDDGLVRGACGLRGGGATPLMVQVIMVDRPSEALRIFVHGVGCAAVGVSPVPYW